MSKDRVYALSIYTNSFFRSIAILPARIISIVMTETHTVGNISLGSCSFIKNWLVYKESKDGLHVNHCENELLIKLKMITVAIDKNPTAPGDFKIEL